MNIVPYLQWKYLSNDLISEISISWKENEYKTAKKDFYIQCLVYIDVYILIVCKEKFGSTFEGKGLLLVFEVQNNLPFTKKNSVLPWISYKLLEACLLQSVH